MCFSIPRKIIKVKNSRAFLEGGKSVKIGSELSVKSGDYVQIFGEVAVSKLSRYQGLKIRQLIKRLN